MKTGPGDTGESRNKPRRGYVNLTTCGGTTQSQQSSGSKKQTASLKQIQQARENQKIKLKRELKELAQLRGSAFGRATSETLATPSQDHEQAAEIQDPESPIFQALKAEQEQEKGMRVGGLGDIKKIKMLGDK